MLLDVPTLMFAGAFVAFVGSVLLVLAWSAYPDMRPVLWWAGANFAQGVSLTLVVLGVTLPSMLLLASGPACVALSGALLWHAARLVEGHRPRYGVTLAGPLVVLLLGLVPLPGVTMLFEAAAGVLIAAAYLLWAAWIVGHSQQRLGSRWPLALLLGGHALTLVIAAAAAAWAQPFELRLAGSSLSYVFIETLVFLIGSTIFVVAGMRERSELAHRRAATLDALTGLHNRGSFFALAETAAAKCKRSAAPFAVAVLDLDHFKQVNDTFGHAMGDQVLLVLGACAQRLPAGTIAGRIGGEEFALCMPGCGRAAALALVENIRRDFEADARVVGGQPVNCTLSAGLAWCAAGEIAAGALLRDADAALYEAKAQGRNRVVLAGDGPPRRQALVVRVA